MDYCCKCAHWPVCRIPSINQRRRAMAMPIIYWSVPAIIHLTICIIIVWIYMHAPTTMHIHRQAPSAVHQHPWRVSIQRLASIWPHFDFKTNTFFIHDSNMQPTLIIFFSIRLGGTHQPLFVSNWIYTLIQWKTIKKNTLKLWIWNELNWKRNNSIYYEYESTTISKWWQFGRK